MNINMGYEIWRQSAVCSGFIVLRVFYCSEGLQGVMDLTALG